MSDAAGWIICNRGARRVALLDQAQAVLHLDMGAGPRPHKVLDLSLVGLAFEIAESETAVREGENLQNALLRVGATEVRGTIHVVRLGTADGTTRVCGASFEPDGDADRQALASLVRELDAAHGSGRAARSGSDSAGWFEIADEVSAED